MKARQIRKLRRRISSKGYYQERLDYWLNKCSQMHTFYKFECNEFFRGHKVASHNIGVYNREMPRIEAQIDWYERKINNQ